LRPPSRVRSTTSTRRPSPAAKMAAISPAAPAPMMTMSGDDRVMPVPTFHLSLSRLAFFQSRGARAAPAAIALAVAIAAITALSASAQLPATALATFRVADAFAFAHTPSRASATALAAPASESSTVEPSVGGAPPALMASPAAAPCLPLTPHNADGNYIVPGVRGAIVYRRIGSDAGAKAATGATSATGTTSVTELSLDAYVQPGGGGPRPGVVVLHGGGWERGSRAAFTGQFLELLTRAGYNWVTVDYRLGTLADHDRAVDDVQAAVAFVRCHARELEIDPARLVLWGEDTGAQLAALLAARPASGIKAMVLVGGFYDLHGMSLPRGTPTGLMLRASPLHRVRRGMPSTLVVHGSADSETPVTQARRYCAELHMMRAACEVIEVEGASHRAENWWPSQWGYKPRVIEWLSRTLSFTAPPGATPAPATPRAHPAGLHKDIVYSPAHGLKLDAYIPPVQGDAPSLFPAVIIAHGGGWEAGDKVTYVTPLFEPLAKAGFAWFSIDYRLTPDVLHPAQLDDLREAIRFVRANASRFNVDPNRIALLGESASGQMVMQVAAESANTANAPDTPGGRDARPAIAAVVSFYGVYDFEPLVESSPSPERTPHWRLFRLRTHDASARAALQAHSPIHHVRRGMPPVLLIHGTNERLWTQGQAMSRVLTDHGVPHELIALEGAPHGLENWEGHAPWMHYKSRLIDWLREQLRQNIPER
jgi:acetyl esterase